MKNNISVNVPYPVGCFPVPHVEEHCPTQRVLEDSLPGKATVEYTSHPPSSSPETRNVEAVSPHPRHYAFIH
jgi:hypothetical protein